MDISPLVLEEAKCMFENLILTRKQHLVKFKLIKRLIICMTFITIMGAICSYLSIKYRSLEKGTYERGKAEGFDNGLNFATFIGYIIMIVWISHKYDKDKEELELEISTADKLNMKESIEEIKRLDALKRAKLIRSIPLVVLFLISFIGGTIVGDISSKTPDCTAVIAATSNGTVL